LQKIRLLDEKSEMVGQVMKSLAALRVPLVHEIYPCDFEIILHDEKLGKVGSFIGIGKRQHPQK